MEASDHDDAVRIDPIEEAVRESTKRCAANLPVKYLVGLRSLGNEARNLGCGIQEFAPKARSLSLVPGIRFGEFCLGRWSKNDWLHRDEPMR
jgi:hypothetical protein